MGRCGQRQADMHLHPYGISAEDEFTPIRSMPNSKRSLAAKETRRAIDSCTFSSSLFEDDGVARAEPISRPWWRPAAKWPTPVSAFFPLTTSALTSHTRGAFAAASVRTAGGGGGDYAGGQHHYYIQRGDCREARSTAAAVAWYQLTYDTPAPSASPARDVQSLGITSGVDLATAAAAFSKRAADSFNRLGSLFDMRGNKESLSAANEAAEGVHGELPISRQALTATKEGEQCGSLHKDGKAAKESTIEETTTLLHPFASEGSVITEEPLSLSSPAANLSPSVSLRLRQELSTKAGSCAKEERTAFLTSSSPPPPKEEGVVHDSRLPPNVSSKTGDVTLERLMSAVRSARSLARRQNQHEQKEEGNEKN